MIAFGFLLNKDTRKFEPAAFGPFPERELGPTLALLEQLSLAGCPGPMRILGAAQVVLFPQDLGVTPRAIEPLLERFCREVQDGLKRVEGKPDDPSEEAVSLKIYRNMLLDSLAIVEKLRRDLEDIRRVA